MIATTAGTAILFAPQLRAGLVRAASNCLKFRLAGLWDPRQEAVWNADPQDTCDRSTIVFGGAGVENGGVAVDVGGAVFRTLAWSMVGALIAWWRCAMPRSRRTGGIITGITRPDTTVAEGSMIIIAALLIVGEAVSSFSNPARPTFGPIGRQRRRLGRQPGLGAGADRGAMGATRPLCRPVAAI